VETSILDLANLINKLTGNPARLDFLPQRDWDRSGKRFGSTEKTRLKLGFEAGVNLNTGLAATIEWTRQNLTMIAACIHKHDKYMIEATGK
jgi:nucleoside-diphosphate-sugar epimerase